MAEFLPAHKITRKVEGNWANTPGDGGGMTYAGITYNFNPEWAGWPIIFAYQKSLGRPLRNNEEVPGVEPLVTSFYKTEKWDKMGFGKIKNQDVSNIIYDFIINSSSTGVLETEQVLQNILKAPIVADRNFDQQTINVINAQDPARLFKAILDERDKFYVVIANLKKKYIVEPGDTVASIIKKFSLPANEMPYTSIAPGQVLQLKTNLQFLTGWLKRLNVFRGITPAAVAGGGIGIVLALAGFFFS